MSFGEARFLELAEGEDALDLEYTEKILRYQGIIDPLQEMDDFIRALV